MDHFVPGDLPFGLALSELRSAVSAYQAEVSAADLRTATVSVSHDMQGLHKVGGSAIVTIQLAGNTTTVPLFLKQNTGEHRREAGRYRFLANQGVPTPRLLDAIERPDAEIVVLEVLPRIGIDPSSEFEVGELLRLLAKLNVARPNPELVTTGPGMPKAEFVASVRTGFEELPGIDVDGWYAAYQFAAERVAAMPRALCHGEFYFQQVGWAERDGVRTLVVFDLETLAYRPRFADIASVLYALATATGRTEQDLFADYLAALERLSGTSVDADAGYAELRMARWYDLCCGMPWRLGQHAAAPGSVALQDTIACMRADLAAIDW